jgi:hypothetical protein
MARFTTTTLSRPYLLRAPVARRGLCRRNSCASPPNEIEKRFWIADQNGDGALSRQEMEHAGWRPRSRRSYDRRPRGTVTLAGDRICNRARVQEVARGRTDRDGRVSAQEAQGGSLCARSAVSDDGDGYLSSEELERRGQRSYYENAELPSVAPEHFEKRF